MALTWRGLRDLLLSTYAARHYPEVPRVSCNNTVRNAAILSACAAALSAFVPAWWACMPHAQAWVPHVVHWLNTFVNRYMPAIVRTWCGVPQNSHIRFVRHPLGDATECEHECGEQYLAVAVAPLNSGNRTSTSLAPRPVVFCVPEFGVSEDDACIQALAACCAENDWQLMVHCRAQHLSERVNYYHYAAMCRAVMAAIDCRARSKRDNDILVPPMVAVGMQSGANITCLYQGIKQRSSPFLAAFTLSSAPCNVEQKSNAAYAARDNALYITSPLMCVAADDDPISPHGIESMLGVADPDSLGSNNNNRALNANIVTVRTKRGGCMGWMERDTGLWWLRLCGSYIAWAVNSSTP